MFNTIEEAITDLKQGKVVIVVDDESRENEGDFVGLADHASSEMINFMITYGKGLVCCPLSQAKANNLGLDYMVTNNQDSFKTAFTYSVDHKDSTTGISAQERSNTIKALASNTTNKTDFVAPGHIFPLIAKDGGVITRNGHTEAAVDLAKLSGANECGIICEIINNDGTMARLPQLEIMAREHNLKLIHIKDLIKYRKSNEQLLNHISQAKLPTKHGEFNIHGFASKIDNQEVIALTTNKISQTPLVRIHSECLTGDSFGSLRCDCGEQLQISMQQIAKHGGAIIYLRQEGRGIGLLNKIKAYNLQDDGMDTVEANLHLGFADDLREYSLAAMVLKYLNMKKIKLLSNNPRKLNELSEYGIEVISREELIVNANEQNADYLRTKVTKLGHLLDN